MSKITDMFDTFVVRIAIFNFISKIFPDEFKI